jgi:FecR protein/Glucodextranase, domain B
MYKFFLISCFFMALGHAQTILTLEGTIEIRSAPEDAWRPASVGETLEARGSIRSFQGDVTLEAAEYTLRITNDTELLRGLLGYELIQGKAYVEAQAVKFNVGGPAKIEGKARLDTDTTNGQRIVVLDGEVTATTGAKVIKLERSQQMVIPTQGDISVSEYFERDPWYLNLSVLAEGSALVIGMMGNAEIYNENWNTAKDNDVLEPGFQARTGPESWLEVRFEDSSLLRLQADTEITLAQSETFADNTRRTLVTLQKGKIWAVIEHGQPFEIETPGLVAGVRGTKFRVDAAQDGADPLLKTFEGTVAGIVGFEIVNVENGKQFEPQVGAVELRKDALDEFNLLRDKLIAAPNLKLEFPIITDQSTITIQGQVDPGSLVKSNGVTLTATDGAFSLERNLSTGLNIIDIRASLVEGGKEARIIQPVFRVGQDFSFVVNEPTTRGGNATLTGYLTSQSTLVITTPLGSQEIVSSGYFKFILPLTSGSNQITLEATSVTGQTQIESFTLEP